MASESSILDFLSREQVVSLHSRQFSKGVAGWIRLYILVTFLLCPVEASTAFQPALMPLIPWILSTRLWIFSVICIIFCIGSSSAWLLGFSLGFSFGSPVSWTFPAVLSRVSNHSPKIKSVPVLVFAMLCFCSWVRRHAAFTSESLTVGSVNKCSDGEKTNSSSSGCQCFGPSI